MSTVNDEAFFQSQAATVTDYSDLNARGFEFTMRFREAFPDTFAALAARRDAEVRNPKRHRGPRAA